LPRFDALLRVSVRQVLRQRWRNLGVAIAIALGTAGFVVIVTMGQDVRESLNRDLELLGGVTRIKAYFIDDLGKYSVSTHQWFRGATVVALRRLPAVVAVTRAAFKTKPVLYTKHDRQFTINQLAAVDEFFWEVNGISAITGRLFGAEEVEGRKKVCVLGARVAKMIFGHSDATGQLLLIDGEYFRVMGVLRGLGVADRAEWIVIPITTSVDRIKKLGPQDVVYLRCHSWDDVERVAAAIPEIIRAHQPDDGLRLKVAWDALKRVVRMAWGVQFFVYLAVSATLILGGFGIWNITMSGVRARTREIGLKKAMGAEDRDILAQFLAEALFLSLGAAVVGVVLGRAGVELLASVLGSHPSEELFLFCVVLSLIFAVVLGIGAGLPPSIRASRMEVVSAVRYE